MLLVAACSSADRPPCTDARICERSYPSIFQAWNPAQNLNAGPGQVTALDEPVEATMARHDLIWKGPGAFGLVWNGPYPGAATSFTDASVATATALRQRLLSLNPKLILFAEVRHHDAVTSYVPDDSPWWQRDASGNRIIYSQSSAGDGTHYYLDLSQPALQDQIALQCRAILQTGAVDGCMLDWWSQETPERIALIRKVRDAVGPEALLLVNVNGKRPTQSAPYVNGMYMEGLHASFFPDWKTAADNIEWAEAHLRVPAFSALDVWAENGRDDYAAMRFATAIALIHGNGYALFADDNSLATPDHLHDWYPFWDRSLGRPTGAPTAAADHTQRREYERGTVVLNPPDATEVMIEFTSPRTRISTGAAAIAHSLAAGDADLFLR